jgi:hypothetical protein
MVKYIYSGSCWLCTCDSVGWVGQKRACCTTSCIDLQCRSTEAFQCDLLLGPCHISDFLLLTPLLNLLQRHLRTIHSTPPEPYQVRITILAQPSLRNGEIRPLEEEFVTTVGRLCRFKGSLNRNEGGATVWCGMMGNAGRELARRGEEGCCVDCDEDGCV